MGHLELIKYFIHSFIHSEEEYRHFNLIYFMATIDLRCLLFNTSQRKSPELSEIY